MDDGKDMQSLQSALLESLQVIRYSADESSMANRLLEILGAYYQGARTFFFCMKMQKTYMKSSYEWCAPAVESQIEMLRDKKISVFSDWIAALEERRYLYLDRKEGKGLAEEKYLLLKEWGIESIMIAPVYVNGRIQGFLTVDEPGASKREESLLLCTVAAFIGTRMERVLSDEELIVSAFRQVYVCIYIWDLMGGIYREIKTPEEMHTFFSETGALSEMQAVIRENVDSAFQEDLIFFTEPSTLTERMVGKPYLMMEYLDNTIGWTKVRIIPFQRSEDGAIEKVLLTLEDIDQEKKRDVHMTYMAEHDGLTRVLNRMAFSRITAELKHSDEPLAFVILDVDRFKEINDTYGHLIGDEVLKRVAGILNKKARSTDYVFRMGGDEFSIILLYATREGEESIRHRLEEISNQILESDGEIPGVSISVGIAFSQNGFTDDLYQRADAMLYQAKEKRGTICEE